MDANPNKMEKYFEELIVDYLTGNLSEPDAARFLEFVQSDEQHRRRFEELGRLYRLFPVLKPTRSPDTGRWSSGSPYPAARRRLGGLPAGYVLQQLL